MEPTFTAALATHSSVVAGDFCDVSVIENVISGYRWVDGEEFAEWAPAGEVAMDPVETTVTTADYENGAREAADEILRDNGWHRSGPWEYGGDGVALYANVEPF